jgi:ATP/maltotriose-dependent transcriptional regulator MalT
MQRSEWMSGVGQSQARKRLIKVSDELARGRRLCEKSAWADAFQSLSRADKRTPLGVEDLELLATSAYLVGREEIFLNALDRAHSAYRKSGETERAARCAFWLGLSLLLKGETGRGTGWLSGARRLIERDKADCVERGYLLLPTAEQFLGADDLDAAYETALDAVEIGDRFGEADLVACARHIQGRALMLKGQIEEGLALLDEAMVAITSGELSPLMTGLIYCSVIDACQQIYAVARAREWTSALAQWCEAQPQMVAFTGTCLVHRAEIMQLHGAWREAIEEARRACERYAKGIEPRPPAAAFYRQGEVHRLRGEFRAAETAYRNASRQGYEPQPGLALLRMTQGRTDAAAAAISRVLSTTTDRLQRTRLLSAYVEVMLAAGDIEDARVACHELADTAESFDTGVLGAMAAHARGAVELADGDPRAALASLRRAFEVWRRIEAPYEAARVRLLTGLACRALGDEEGARLELDAARAVFEQLGATPDLVRIDSLAKGVPSDQARGMTPRELQVLRLVAAGKTNKAIAAELFVSAKTVDRHVSNIFGKLDVPSRAAATAYAYEHKLI